MGGDTQQSGPYVSRTSGHYNRPSAGYADSSKPQQQADSQNFRRSGVDTRSVSERGGPLGDCRPADAPLEPPAVPAERSAAGGPAHDDVEVAKSNILMLGPTGCGKTHLVRTLARIVGVPVAISDATALTQAGYVGDDVESVLTKLLAAAGNDAAVAAEGIVFLDEIDKLARRPGAAAATTRDVSGEGVQQALLKLVEGDVISVPLARVATSAPGAGVSSGSAAGKPPGGAGGGKGEGAVALDTSNILFIVGGAFAGIDERVSARLHRPGLGFGATLKRSATLAAAGAAGPNGRRGAAVYDSESAARVEAGDLVDYGLIPEFVGRFPCIAPLSALTHEELVRVIDEPRNAVLRQFSALLADEGATLTVTPAAKAAIAAEADTRGTGARGLRGLFEGLLLDAQFRAPEHTDCSVFLDAEHVKSFVDGTNPTGAVLLLPDVPVEEARHGGGRGGEAPARREGDGGDSSERHAAYAQ